MVGFFQGLSAFARMLTEAILVNYRLLLVKSSWVGLNTALQ